MVTKWRTKIGKSFLIMEPDLETPRPIEHVSPSAAPKSMRFSQSEGMMFGSASSSFLADLAVLIRNGAQTLPSARVVMPSVTCSPILPSDESS